MHTPLLQKPHVFSQVVHGIEHHKLATILVAMALFWLVYALSTSIDYQLFTQQLTTSDVAPIPYNIVRPLSRIDDPEYAHEYDLRVRSIRAHLERLKSETRADRVYVVAYSHGPARFGDRLEKKISNTFEVGQKGLISQIRDFRGLSMMEWIEYTTANGFYSLLSPLHFDMELFDEDGAVIGHIGIEYLHDMWSFQGNETDLLRETAAAIEVALLQPLEHLKGPEKM